LNAIIVVPPACAMLLFTEIYRPSGTKKIKLTYYKQLTYYR
jgi:hypothetical protein